MSRLSIIALFVFMLGNYTASAGLAEYTSKPAAVVFDIDDTLVDTNYRTLHILHEIGSELNIAQLETLRYDQVNFYCSVTLKNVNLTDADLLEKVCGNPKTGTLQTSLWGARFFSQPEYIQFDGVMSGAPQFVKRVQETLGVEIFYLTGRNKDHLAEATDSELRFHGFPMGIGTHLMMKSETSTLSDTDFKREALKQIQLDHSVVGAFDDSLDNANMFRQALDASVPVIRPVRNLLKNAGILPGIDLITDFYSNETVSPNNTRTVVPNKDQINGLIQHMADVQSGEN